MYTLEPPVCIPKHCRRSAIPGQHAICFRKSRILRCGAFRLLFWWLYLHRRLRPGNEAQDCSRATGLSFGVYFQRLLPVFIRALKKASQLSLASLSASTLGVTWNNSRLLFHSPGRYRHVRRSLCWSSKPVSPATRRVILQAIFFVKLLCVLFFFLRRRKLVLTSLAQESGYLRVT